MKYTAALVCAVLAVASSTACAASVPRVRAIEVTAVAGLAQSSSDGGDGIKIDVTRRVSCARKTRINDIISVIYNLTLTDGTKIESTKPGDSFTFTLGVGQVIDGWDMGLKDMCIGEKRCNITLTIPPAFGYGLEAVGRIPGNSTLVFETELLAIEGA